MFFQNAVWLVYGCCFFLKILFRLKINIKLPVASSGDPDPSLSITTSFLRKKILTRLLGWLQTPLG